MRRFITFLLSVMTVFNFTCPVAAEQTSTDAQPQLHTVTWTMNPEYTLEPITGSHTSMLDEGSVLTNINNLSIGIGDVYVTSSNPTKHYEHRENGSGQTKHSQITTIHKLLSYIKQAKNYQETAVPFHYLLQFWVDTDLQ